MLVAGQVLIGIPWPRRRSRGASVKANRTVPKVKPVPATPVFSAYPTEEELFRARVFEEPLVPVMAPSRPRRTSPSPERSWRTRAEEGGEAVDAFVAFLEAHGTSPWRASLLLNLGIVYRRTGYPSRALEAFSEAWGIARQAEDPAGGAVADRAVAELALLLSRFGRPRSAAEGAPPRWRSARWAAWPSELLEQARQGMWLMRTSPSQTLRCGPVGVEACSSTSARASSGTRGCWSIRPRCAGRPSRRWRRCPPSTDSTCAWRSAWMATGKSSSRRSFTGRSATSPRLCSRGTGGYLVKDPVQGGEMWISRKAYDSEASGMRWCRQASFRGAGARSRRTRGRRSGPGPHGPQRPAGARRAETCRPRGCKSAAQGVVVRGRRGQGPRELLLPQHAGEPVRLGHACGYSPPRGPGVGFQVLYHQREAFQPQIPSFWNMGPKWTSTWLSWVEDDPATPGQPANVYLQGGGRRRTPAMTLGPAPTRTRPTGGRGCSRCRALR